MHLLRLPLRRHRPAHRRRTHRARRPRLPRWGAHGSSVTTATATTTALVDGRPASMDAAVEAAAEHPGARRSAADLRAGQLDVRIRSAPPSCSPKTSAASSTRHTSMTHGPSKLGAQLVGKVTCTLGEVRNRADLVIYWGTNPVETHPRHLTRVRLHARRPVRAWRTSRSHDDPGRRAGDVERQGRRPVPADPTRHRLRNAHRASRRSSAIRTSIRICSPPLV